MNSKRYERKEGRKKKRNRKEKKERRALLRNKTSTNIYGMAFGIRDAHGCSN